MRTGTLIGFLDEAHSKMVVGVVSDICMDLVIVEPQGNSSPYQDSPSRY